MEEDKIAISAVVLGRSLFLILSNGVGVPIKLLVLCFRIVGNVLDPSSWWEGDLCVGPESKI